MFILDLESGKRFSSKKQAASALEISLREVTALLAVGWLVRLSVPSH